MPNPDSVSISQWVDEESGTVINNRDYVRHFSEIVTRKLRRELEAERVEEPKYTHSLEEVEVTALFFLQSAQGSTIREEQIALFHEAAILFEQLSSLWSHEDLKQKDAPELAGQRFILAACCYFLAGYEANATVMARALVTGKTTYELSITASLVALLLSKSLRELRTVLASNSLDMPSEDASLSKLISGNYLFGDAVYEAWSSPDSMDSELSCF